MDLKEEAAMMHAIRRPAGPLFRPASGGARPMSEVGDRKRQLGRAIFGVLVVLAFVAAGVSGADARAGSSGYARNTVRASAFDGRWSITIETDRGSCERSTRVGLIVMSGVVTYEGTPYGRVTAKGKVRVQFTIGAQRADGSGRLSQASGAGVWRGVGSSGRCSGRWSAERRD